MKIWLLKTIVLLTVLFARWACVFVLFFNSKGSYYHNFKYARLFSRFYEIQVFRYMSDEIDKEEFKKITYRYFTM